MDQSFDTSRSGSASDGARRLGMGRRKCVAAAFVKDADQVYACVGTSDNGCDLGSVGDFCPPKNELPGVAERLQMGGAFRIADCDADFPAGRGEASNEMATDKA